MLTDRQSQILDYIKLFIHEEGLPPTRAEIASAFAWKSPNAAEEHLRAMARKGVLELKPGISRGIKVLT